MAGGGGWVGAADATAATGAAVGGGASGGGAAAGAATGAAAAAGGDGSGSWPQAASATSITMAMAIPASQSKRRGFRSSTFVVMCTSSLTNRADTGQSGHDDAVRRPLP